MYSNEKLTHILLMKTLSTMDSLLSPNLSDNAWYTCKQLERTGQGVISLHASIHSKFVHY